MFQYTKMSSLSLKNLAPFKAILRQVTGKLSSSFQTTACDKMSSEKTTIRVNKIYKIFFYFSLNVYDEVSYNLHIIFILSKLLIFDSLHSIP